MDSLKIEPGDIWLEIGPGQGALTRYFPTDASHLYLVEIDTDLAKALETGFSNRSNVTILNQDILTLDLSRLDVGGQRLRLLGNLPYNISTPLFFHLADYTQCINDMTFMVQKEVADRLTAEPGTKQYGRLSLSAGLRFVINRLFDVGPGAFHPPPKVKSSIIRLTPRQQQFESTLQSRFDLLVRTAFSQRRKTLRNSLGKLVDASTLVRAGINPQSRAESLTIDDFLSLAQRMI